jgi:hypothetical protein
VVLEAVGGDADDLDVALLKVGGAPCNFAELGRADGGEVWISDQVNIWTRFDSIYLRGGRREHPNEREIGKDAEMSEENIPKSHRAIRGT